MDNTEKILSSEAKDMREKIHTSEYNITFKDIKDLCKRTKASHVIFYYVNYVKRVIIDVMDSTNGIHYTLDVIFNRYDTAVYIEIINQPYKTVRETLFNEDCDGGVEKILNIENHGALTTMTAELIAMPHPL